eukprot:377963-Prorocentrum_minimum.AAC.1
MGQSSPPDDGPSTARPPTTGPSVRPPTTGNHIRLNTLTLREKEQMSNNNYRRKEFANYRITIIGVIFLWEFRGLPGG